MGAPGDRGPRREAGSWVGATWRRPPLGTVACVTSCFSLETAVLFSQSGIFRVTSEGQRAPRRAARTLLGPRATASSRCQSWDDSTVGTATCCRSLSTPACKVGVLGEVTAQQMGSGGVMRGEAVWREAKWWPCMCLVLGPARGLGDRGTCRVTEERPSSGVWTARPKSLHFNS